MVLSGKPACYDIRVEVINGAEFIICGEAGVKLSREMVARGKEEDSRDMGNVMLMEDVMDGDTIWSVRNGVFGVREGCIGLVILDDHGGVIVVGSDDFTGRGKIGAEGVLGNWDMSLIGRHIVDEIVGVEKSVGNIDGNRADLMEGVAHEAHNEGAVIGGKVNGRHTDEAHCAFVLEEDGGSLGDEGLEAVEIEVWGVECISKLLAQGCNASSRDGGSGGILSCSNGLLLLGEGGEGVVAEKVRVEHSGRG